MTVEIVHADSLAWVQGRDPRRWSVLFVDPPYGAEYASSREGTWKGKGIEGDSDTVARDGALAWWGDGAAAVWTKWNYGWFGDPRGMLVWDKGPGVGMGDLKFPWKPNWEMCCIYGPGWSGHRGTSVIKATVPSWSGGTSMSTPSVHRSHPHEKPLGLCMAILEKAPPGECLDLFGGGGTVAVACARLGRPCTIVEIDERWIPTIERRVATEGAQRPLWGES